MVANQGCSFYLIINTSVVNTVLQLFCLVTEAADRKDVVIVWLLSSIEQKRKLSDKPVEAGEDYTKFNSADFARKVSENIDPSMTGFFLLASRKAACGNCLPILPLMWCGCSLSVLSLLFEHSFCIYVCVCEHKD